jgi:hypothetical protein
MSLRIMCSFLILVLVWGPALAKHKERQWQEGKLVDTDESHYFAGTLGSGGGTVYASGNSAVYSESSTRTAIYRVYETYIIEADRYVYVAKERIKWRWSKPALVTVNGPVRFAIEKDKIYILGEDGKEHETRLAKKILRPTR